MSFKCRVTKIVMYNFFLRLLKLFVKMDRKSWANIKKSGGFKRKVKKNYNALLMSNCMTSNICTGQVNFNQIRVGSVQNFILNSTKFNLAQSGLQDSVTLSTESGSSGSTIVEEKEGGSR